MTAPTAKKKRYLREALIFFFNLFFLNIQNYPPKIALKVVILPSGLGPVVKGRSMDANVAKPLTWRMACGSVRVIKTGKTPMDYVRAKKNLGQHFLKDQNIARKIVESLQGEEPLRILEIGPGMGVLTRFLVEIPQVDLRVVEIDRESVAYLRSHFPGLAPGLVEGDFLKIPLRDLFPGPFSVIGNFPYNISSQIFFRVLEHRDLITEVVGMVQKEVAERIAAPPGSKTYGILSVLLQAFYHIEYLFTVGEQVFSPPPKVKSAVIRLRRNNREALGCDERLFFEVVKRAFNQRRKMVGNALKPLGVKVPDPFAGKRAEQLSVTDFETLTWHLSQMKGGE